MFRFSIILLLTALLACAEITPEKALDQARTDLKSAISKLEKTRELIANEKPSISADFVETETELSEKRRLVRIARQSAQDRAEEIRQLKADLAVRTDDAAYSSGLLKDHALKTSTLATPGSSPLGISPENLNTPSLTGRLVILDASLDRLEAILGGSTATGQAADPEGEVHQGTFAALGPASYFLSEDKSTGGDVTLSKTGNIPTFTPQEKEDIENLLAGKTATLPLDVTGGNARAIDEVSGGPLDLIRKGGLWIWPIVFLAILSLVFGMIKLGQFLRYREPTDSWVDAILAALRTGDHGKAIRLAREPSHPAAPVMEKLVAVSGNPADLIEETLYEQLISVQAKAGTLLPVIAITAATAPLIGLLGTVSGMITTFNLITLFGSGDPKPLAGGISEALITTLFGLVVAIPSLILHAFLSRRAAAITQSTERFGLTFINGLRMK